MCSGWNITGKSLCTFSKAVGVCWAFPFLRIKLLLAAWLTTLAWPGMPLLTWPWSNYVWNVKLPESEFEDFNLLAASTVFEKVRLVQITGKMVSYSHFAEDRLCIQEEPNRNWLSHFFFNTKLFELIILSSTRGIAKHKYGMVFQGHCIENTYNQTRKKKCHLLIKAH